MVTDLSVVVVNWNVRGLLQRCLSSIMQSPGLHVRPSPAQDADGTPPPVADTGPHTALTRNWETEVIVVDNASSDGSADLVKEQYPQARVIENASNRGFTAAVNQGLAATSGRYVLVLNPDTEVVGDAVATMLAYMESHAGVGLLGPRLLRPNGSIQSSRRRFPTLATALVESTIIQGLFTDSHTLRRYYMADGSDDEAQEVDWVVGAAMLVRREVIAQVGGLDEGFFMYSEELDWCKRIKAHAATGPLHGGPVAAGAESVAPSGNWQVFYLPAARVVHYEGKSSEQALAIRHVNFHASKVRYFRKHHGWWQGQAVRWFILGTYVWQMAEESVKWLLGHKRSLRRQRLQVYWQVIRSGLVVGGRGGLVERPPD